MLVQVLRLLTKEVCYIEAVGGDSSDAVRGRCRLGDVVGELDDKAPVLTICRLY